MKNICVIDVWQWLTLHHPGMDAVITSSQQRLKIIKLPVAETGEMGLGEMPKQKVGFLHAGIACLIDKAAQPVGSLFVHDRPLDPVLLILTC